MEFSAGRAMGRAFSVVHKHLLVFLVLGAVVQAPFLVVSHVLLGDAPDIELVEGPEGTGLRLPEGITLTQGLLQWFLAPALDSLMAGAMAYGVFQGLRGQRPTVGACLLRALTRIVPILLTSALVWLILGACYGAAWLVTGARPGLSMTALLLGTVPAVALLCALFVTTACATVEPVGPLTALKRSWSLTSGRRATILGALLLCILALIPISALAGLLGAALAPAGEAVVQGALNLYTSVLVGALGAVCYHDLRVVKEGATTDDLVKVFS